MKMKELRALLQAAIEKQGAVITALEGSDNPQTVAMRTKAEATFTTLHAVIEALDAPRPGAAYDLQLLAQ